MTAPRETTEGQTITVTLYAYPDGHGFVRAPGLSTPVHSDAEAEAQLAGIWRELVAAAKSK